MFLAKSRKDGQYQIVHFPEPVNSIFDEADGLMADDESYILFVSDKPGHVGDYHKKDGNGILAFGEIPMFM